LALRPVFPPPPTAPPRSYTLSLHDALPISRERAGPRLARSRARPRCRARRARRRCSDTRSSKTGRRLAARNRSSGAHTRAVDRRSEEHTSELQSRENLVCRLLLEKKKKKRK